MKGLIPGTLGYERKVELISEALLFRQVETFNYEIYAGDFLEVGSPQGYFGSFSPSSIQEQIHSEFVNIYKGDIRVKVFKTENTLQYPSDSIRSAKFVVNVEVVSNITTPIDLQMQNYGNRLLNFREDLTFSKNDSGNREFEHSISFNIRSLEGVPDNEDERKTIAQTICEVLFNETKEYENVLTQIDPSLSNEDFNNNKVYYSETYDLKKNYYSFSKKRQILPLGEIVDGSYNLTHSLTMNENGIIEVAEKASFLGVNTFNDASIRLNTFINQSFNRCNEVYENIKFSLEKDSSSLNSIKTKLTKEYNKQSLTCGYNITYTDNPELEVNFMVSEVLDFQIGEYNKVEASHTFEYTFTKFNENSPLFLNNVIQDMAIRKNQTYSAINSHYSFVYSHIQSMQNLGTLKLIKTNSNLPNIKTRASIKFSYSNDPTYFVQVEDKKFNTLNVSVTKKLPNDIINEYKIINTPNKKSILSYAFQGEQGSVEVKSTASLGKNSRQFAPNDIYSFYLGNSGQYDLAGLLPPLYRLSASKFIESFANNTIIGLNWFISDASFSLDSDGNLNSTINYTYMYKMH